MAPSGRKFYVSAGHGYPAVRSLILPAAVCAMAICRFTLPLSSASVGPSATFPCQSGGFVDGRAMQHISHRIRRVRPTLQQACGSAGSGERVGDPPVRRSIVLAGVWGSGVVQLAAPAAALADGGTVDDEPFSALAERYRPEHPPVRSKSSPAEVALAKHLKAVGAACYTAWWCPHCQEQREQFGAEAMQYAPFVQCSSKSGEQLPVCEEKGIEGYPMWIIRGQTYRGGKELSRLAILTNFTEFPADAFSERPDEVTEYIWGREESSDSANEADS